MNYIESFPNLIQVPLFALLVANVLGPTTRKLHQKILADCYSTLGKSQMNTIEYGFERLPLSTNAQINSYVFELCCNRKYYGVIRQSFNPLE